MSEFPQTEIEEQPIDRQKIIEGDALPEILRCGFGEYRSCLAEDIDWRDIVRSQCSQIRGLASHPFDNLPHGFQGNLTLFERVTINENQRVKRELLDSGSDFVDSLKTNYEREDVTIYRQGTQKIYARGRNNEEKCWNNPDGKVELTRIYLTVPTMRAPTIFQNLISRARGRGVLSDIDIVLNLETYDNESVDTFCTDNTVIIYVPAITGSREEDGVDFDGVFQAINDARETNPAMWRLQPDRSKVYAKLGVLRSFKIPVDDNISFVECDNDNSFDTRDGVRLRQSYGINYDDNGDEYATKMENIFQQIKPLHPGSFQFRQTRKWRMPGLIYQ